MNKQLIADEKFTNIQEAQAGLAKLLASAKKTGDFYRVLKNNKPVGVLLPNKTWDAIIEDLEALGSKKYLFEIKKARLEKKSVSSASAKKKLGLT